MLNDMKIFKKSYELFLWFQPMLLKFPKSRQYSIGKRIEDISLRIIEGIIELNYSHDKKIHLEKLNVELEKLRILIRLSKDLKLIDFKKYEISSEKINEIGKLLGGLIKVFNKCP